MEGCVWALPGLLNEFWASPDVYRLENMPAGVEPTVTPP